MKRLLTLLFVLGILFVSKSYAQDDPYWTENWDDTTSTNTFPTSSPGPLTETAVVISTSGEWKINAVYRGGSSSACNGSPRTLRMPKPETVQGAGAVPPGYAITPNLDEGVGKVVFKSGRTGTNRIIGIYKSSDDGATWELVAKTEKGIGQKCTDTTIVVNDANANRIKFTSEGTGDNDLEDIMITRYKSVGVEEEGLPTTFELNQNYPNPFNPSTTITYSLPKASSVQIKVYDQLGREVATLLNDEMPSGTHSLVWNAAQTSQSLASGVYFVQLRAENFTKSIKVMLLK